MRMLSRGEIGLRVKIHCSVVHLHHGTTLSAVPQTPCGHSSYIKQDRVLLFLDLKFICSFLTLLFIYRFSFGNFNGSYLFVCLSVYLGFLKTHAHK